MSNRKYDPKESIAEFAIKRGLGQTGNDDAEFDRWAKQHRPDKNNRWLTAILITLLLISIVGAIGRLLGYD